MGLNQACVKSTNSLEATKHTYLFEDFDKKIAEEIAISLTNNKTYENPALFDNPQNISCVDYYYKKCQSKIHSWHNITLNNKKSVIGVIVTSDGSTSHVAAPYISIVKYSKENNNGWFLDNISFAVTQAGEWGILLKNAVSVVEIGKEKIGIIIENGYTAQGQTTSGLTILAEINNSFKETCCDIIYSDSGYENYPKRALISQNWKSDYFLVKNDSNLYDIKIITKGNKISKFEKNGISFRNEFTLKFDGQKYTSDNIPEYMKTDW